MLTGCAGSFLLAVGGASKAIAAPSLVNGPQPAPQGEPGGAVLFTDVTAAAGLLRARNVSGSPENKQFLLEEMGGGAAFFDYDHDGWIDIFPVSYTHLTLPTIYSV